LAVEVISEANSPEKIERKIATYFAHGTEEIWVVYPNTQRIRKLRPDGATWYGDRMTSSLFSGLELEFAEIFA
jgi:Uma2 family endonuclease